MTLRVVTSQKICRFLFASVLIAWLALMFSVSAQAQNRASLVNLWGGNLKVCFHRQNDPLLLSPLKVSWGCQEIAPGKRARWSGSTRAFRVQVFRSEAITGLCSSYLEFPKNVPSPWNLAILGHRNALNEPMCRITGEFASQVVFRNSSKVRITNIRLFNADDVAKPEVRVAFAEVKFTPGQVKDIPWPITTPNFNVQIKYVDINKCSGVGNCDEYIAEKINSQDYYSCQGKIHALQGKPKRGVFLVEFSGELEPVFGERYSQCNLKYVDPSEW